MSVGSTNTTPNASFQSIQSLNLSGVDIELLSIVLQGQQSQIRMDQLSDLSRAMEVSRQRILQAAQLKKDAAEAVKDVLAKVAEKEKEEFRSMKDKLASGQITVREFEEWAEEHGVEMPDFPPGASLEEKLEMMGEAIDEAEEKLDAGTLSSPALDKLIAEEFKTNALVAGVNSGLQGLGINAKLDSVASLQTVLTALDKFIQAESAKLEALKEQVKALMQSAIKEFQQFNNRQETGRDNASDLSRRLDNLQNDLQQQEVIFAANRLNAPAIGTIMDPDPLQIRVNQTIQQIDETVAAARSAIEKMEQLYREYGIDPQDVQKYVENLSPADRQRVESDLAEWKAQLQQEINDEIRRNVPETSSTNSNTLPGMRGIRI